VLGGGGSSVGVCALAQLMLTAARLPKSSKIIPRIACRRRRRIAARDGASSFDIANVIGLNCKRQVFTRIAKSYVLAA
jgi:hypothetical protein